MISGKICFLFNKSKIQITFIDFFKYFFLHYHRGKNLTIKQMKNISYLGIHPHRTLTSFLRDVNFSHFILLPIIKPLDMQERESVDTSSFKAFIVQLDWIILLLLTDKKNFIDFFFLIFYIFQLHFYMYFFTELFFKNNVK